MKSWQKGVIWGAILTVIFAVVFFIPYLVNDLPLRGNFLITIGIFGCLFMISGLVTGLIISKATKIQKSPKRETIIGMLIPLVFCFLLAFEIIIYFILMDLVYPRVFGIATGGNEGGLAIIFFTIIFLIGAGILFGGIGALIGWLIGRRNRK